MTAYKVPRILWENLEAVLLTQSKKYIEELAKCLNVSAKELQKRVMPSSDSIQVLLQDVQETVCQGYVQQGNLTVFCKKPVFHGTYCAVHSGNRCIINDTTAITIQRVKDIDQLPPMWIEGSSLLTEDGQKIGTIHRGRQKITIYHVSND
jgi:hypothetical protein